MVLFIIMEVLLLLLLLKFWFLQKIYSFKYLFNYFIHAILQYTLDYVHTLQIDVIPKQFLPQIGFTSSLLWYHL